MNALDLTILAIETGYVSQSHLSKLTDGKVSQQAVSVIVSRRCSPRWDTLQALHAALLRHLGEALSVADGPDHADAVAYLERVRGKWGQAAAERLQAEARAAFEIQADVAEEVG